MGHFWRAKYGYFSRAPKFDGETISLHPGEQEDLRLKSVNTLVTNVGVMLVRVSKPKTHICGSLRARNISYWLTQNHPGASANNSGHPATRLLPVSAEISTDPGLGAGGRNHRAANCFSTRPQVRNVHLARRTPAARRSQPEGDPHRQADSPGGWSRHRLFIVNICVRRPLSACLWSPS